MTWCDRVFRSGNSMAFFSSLHFSQFFLKFEIFLMFGLIRASETHMKNLFTV